MCDINGESMIVKKSDLCMYKLESLCYRLKCAIIDHSLKLPSLVSFRYYLDGISSETELGVVVEMLHDCWIYAFPIYMFDKPLKAGRSLDDIFRASAHDFDENDYISSPLHLSYAKEYALGNKTRAQSRVPEDYARYLHRLYLMVNAQCLKHNLRIDARFMLAPLMPTDLSVVVLKNVYQYLVDRKYIEPNKESDFIAIFSASVVALPEKLRWTYLTKSKLPNYSCLYSLMSTLASNTVSDEHVKSLIASVFCNGDGTSIDVSSFKKRKPSEVQQVFDNDIQNIISKAALEKETGGTLGGSTE